MKKLLFLMSLLVVLAVACSKEEPLPALQVSPGQIEMESPGGEKDVNVTANINWTVSVPSAASDWCVASPASGTDNGNFKVTVKANKTLSTRETEITIKGENLEKKITVTQDPASKEELLTGSKWEITSQGSGDPNYNDLVGTVIEFKADKKAVATLKLVLPDDLGTVERIDGTWSMNGETFILEGELIPGMTAKLSFAIKQMSESVMECQMKIDLPLLPPDGISVVFKKK